MKIVGAICSLVLFLSASVEAQDFTLRVTGPAETPIGSTFDAPVLLDNVGSADVQGWSFGICHDITALTFVDAVEGSTTLTVNGGALPGFLQLNTSLTGGYTLGVVINLFGTFVLPPGVGYELAIGTYTAELTVTTTTIEPCSTLGAVPVSTVVVVGGSSVAPIQIGLTLSIVPPPATPQFVRADANSDGLVDIADGIWVLTALFLSGPLYDCAEANDSNADGNFDTADAIFTFSFQFLGGASPAFPYPACDRITGQTVADCAVFPGCPDQ